MFDSLKESIGLQQIQIEDDEQIFKNDIMKFPICMKEKENALCKILGENITFSSNNMVKCAGTDYKYYFCSETANNQKPWYATTNKKCNIILIYIKKEKGKDKPVYYWIDEDKKRTNWKYSDAEKKYRMNFEWNKDRYVAKSHQGNEIEMITKKGLTLVIEAGGEV